MLSFKETQIIVCGTHREDGSSNWKMEKLRLQKDIHVVFSYIGHSNIKAHDRSIKKVETER
jgi:hypothetical protein